MFEAFELLLWAKKQYSKNTKVKYLNCTFVNDVRPTSDKKQKQNDILKMLIIIYQFFSSSKYFAYL